MKTLALVCLLTPALAAAAEEHVIRIGTIIPDGSGWARETRAVGREAESGAAGKLRIKWFMGAIAGDEVEMAERVRRGQLDGILSGGMMCERLAPSLRVARIPAMFQTWEETSHVIGRLKPTLDKEMQQNGYVNLGDVVIGPSILFTRKPVASLADLKDRRLWVWSTDEVLKVILPELGVRVVPLPIHDAARAYDAGQTDGFVTPAAAALGFQWSAQTRHYTDLRMGFVVACLIVSNRAFDALPLQAQESLRVAAARSQARYERAARAQEQELLGGLFRKQGVQPVPVSDAFRAAFFDAARAARERVAERLVKPELIRRVLTYLADFRGEHR